MFERLPRIVTGGWAIIALAAGVGPAAAQEVGAACAATADELRAAVRDVHDRQRNVGVAAAIALDGRLAFEEYLGMADLEHEVAVGPETRFGIASVTKLFTAVALLRAEAEGAVGLDEPVQRYVSGFPEKPGGTITLGLLATHRAGIPHPNQRTPELFATHYATAADAVDLFRDVELLFPPDSARRYSSSHYNLIAAALESASGRPFPEVVEAGVLGPLELTATGFDDVLAVLPHRTRRYSFYHPWTYAESQELYRVPTWDYSFNPGGGNMYSTARDLVAFGAALFEPGPLLAAPQWERLYDPAWFGRRTDAGERFAYSDGANPGLQAGLAVFPERRVAAVVLSNTWGIGSRSAEMSGLARVLAELCAPAP